MHVTLESILRMTNGLSYAREHFACRFTIGHAYGLIFSLLELDPQSYLRFVREIEVSHEDSVSITIISSGYPIPFEMLANTISYVIGDIFRKAVELKISSVASEGGRDRVTGYLLANVE